MTVYEKRTNPMSGEAAELAPRVSAIHNLFLEWKVARKVNCRVISARAQAR
jgi:hypothetical protein